MTRSFDAFDRDDFRSPDDPDRGTSGGLESFWSLRVRLSELHRKEERADARNREAGTAQGKSVHRFIARSAFGRFWRSGFAPDIYTHTSAEAERGAAIALERAIYGDLFPVVPNIENRNNFAALN